MSERAFGSVPLSQLRPNRQNVRDDLGDLTELAASIRVHGILQPLVIAKPVKGTAVVIDGHRRLAAAQMAGLDAVPCIISDVAPGEATVTVMLAAAMHKSLDPIEQAAAFTALLRHGLSRADIAARTGYSLATVSSRLALAELPKPAQAMVSARTLTVGQGLDLAKQLRRSPEGLVRAGAEHKQPFFTSAHRLSRDAAQRCTPAHAERRQTMAGACGVCWEQAIRADERDEDVAARDDVDELAVQRAVDGDRSLRLNVAEREAAVGILSGMGMSDGEVARRLGITARTVLRCRQRAGVGTSAFGPGRRASGRVSA